jgi:hypothetical protein
MSESTITLPTLTDEQAKEHFPSENLSASGVPVYKSVVKDAFFAKYCLRGDDLVVLFFPDEVYANYVEMSVPVHPDDIARMPKEYAERYARMASHVQYGWPQVKRFWMESFPHVLDATAQSHFSETAPRITAKYTEELYSWWFCARGYSHLIDFDSFVEKFLSALDAAAKQQN